METQTFQVDIQGINIHFPYQPYPMQISFMRQLIQTLQHSKNALLQSPTGTGKTLSILCSFLAWQKYHLQKSKQLIRLIYLSPTHVQLKQVCKQLKKSKYTPKIITLSSREHSCINNKLKLFSGKALEVECKKLVEFKKNQCQFFKKTYDRLKETVFEAVNDLQDMKKLGESKSFCPFYLQKSFKDDVQVILMPYNYLFQQKIAEYYKLPIENSILVMDQAHNIPKFCQQGQTIEISAKTLQKALNELFQYEDKNNILKQSQQRNLNLMRCSINQFIEYMNRFKINRFISREQEENGISESSVNLYNHLVEGTIMQGHSILSKGINTENYLLLRSAFEQLQNQMVKLSHYAYQQWCYFVQFVILHKLKQKKLHPHQINTLDNPINAYSFLAQLEGNNIIFKIICLDPAISFNKIKSKKPRSIILTSGTLAPLNAWSVQLNLQFENKFSYSHTISDQQVFVRILRVGKSGNNLNFSYINREKKSQFIDLCNFIKELNEGIPEGGIVLFFSSFSYLDQTRKYLIAQKILDDIKLNKQVFFETNNKRSYHNFLDQFKNAAKKGAFLFAVFRGKIAEGLDLANQLCRCVCLIGVPYPPIYDKYITAKKKYLEFKSNSANGRFKSFNGSEWYFMQTIRAINQAAGRVIRNMNDYGAILMVDERYTEKNIFVQISEWMRLKCKVENKFEQFSNELFQFFSNFQKRETVCQRKQKIERKGKEKYSQPRQLQKRLSILSEFVQQEINKQEKIELEKEMRSMRRSQQKKKWVENFNKKRKLDQISKITDYFKEKEVLQEYSQCKICYRKKQLLGNSKCIHQFCKECWQFSQQRKIECPLCRDHIRLKYLINYK